MTFFSRAARICIQGLSGGAGGVANAILPILTCVAFIFTVRFIRGVLATALPWRKALAFRPTANCQLPGYRWSGRENPTSGPWINSVSWDAGKLTRTDTIVAHLGIIAIPYSHNFGIWWASCTIDGETRRKNHRWCRFMQPGRIIYPLECPWRRARPTPGCRCGIPLWGDYRWIVGSTCGTLSLAVKAQIFKRKQERIS